MASVMVLGANGHLGRAAVLAFAAAGWQVTALLRRAPRLPLPAGVRCVQGDALDVPATLAAARAGPAGPGFDVIVHALNPDYTQWQTMMPPQTAAVIALARQLGATVMLPGNVYNFGNQLPARLTEATPFAATHAKARQRIALEASLAQAARDQGVRSIVIRAGDFLGDGGTWVDLGMGRALAAGKFTAMGQPNVQHAWAYLPDLAQTFVKVAEQRAQLAPHAVLHFAGHTLTQAALQEAMQTTLGRPLRSVGFPWWLMRLAAAVPVQATAMPRALLEMRYLWQRPHQLDDQGLRHLLGNVPHTPLTDVMRACLAPLQNPPGTETRPGAGPTPSPTGS